MDQVLGTSPQLIRNHPFHYNHVFLDLRQEPGRILAHLSGYVVAFRFCQEQGLLCPCDSHIHQPALLFLSVLLVFTDSPHVREDSLAEAGDEDEREFQTLGLMDGHEPDGAAVLAVVGIRIQGDVLKVFNQSRFFFCMGLFVEPYRA